MTSLMVIFSLAISIPVFGADEDAAQKEACSKNSAKEWNVELGRCVGKAAARQTRHEAQDCDALKDIEAQKACHMQLAESKTGVSGDAEKEASKVSGLQSRSTIINTANTVVAAINLIAKDSSNSSCMSKQIFGITSLGGFLTDIYMKINTKKKLDALKDKFVVENKDNAYSSQVKALEFLKEEQEVIKKIASQEKKRQMLLMIGYGAAAATAAFETFYNTSCWKPEPKKPAPATSDVSANANAAQPAPATQNGQGQASTAATESGAQTHAVKPQGEVQTTDLSPQSAPPAGTASDATKSASAPSSETRLVSQKNGNYQTNYIEQNGKAIGVVHNGQVYDAKIGANGVPVAVGSPKGNFDYNTGSWSGGKVDVAVTTNYELNAGKIISKSSTLPTPAATKDLSFGTNRTGK